VNDAADAVRFATSLHPVAVVVAPATEHGLAILDSLRRRDETATIPIVANAAPGARFLPKPVERAPLIAELKRCTGATTAFSALVLVVASDPRTGECVRSLLEPEGYRVAIARSGSEGVVIAQSDEPDVIIVEPLMPDLTGFEVVEQLAATGGTRATPIVMLTVADMNDAGRARLRQHASAIASNVPHSTIVEAVRRSSGGGKSSRRAARTGTVLVVDDNELNRELARLLLQPIGCRVLFAADGTEGIETARREPPDLILLDLMMPGMDGYAVARILKADATTASIPIVALTARAMRGDEEKARASGMEGYLTKPIDRVAFDACVRSFLT
jgi:CheY-like chemotaxis protein